MLMLTRKVGECIRINDDIVIEVIELGSGRVKLGVSAPAHIPVNREEIYIAKKKSLELESYRNKEY